MHTQPLREANPSTNHYNRFTVDHRTKTYVDSATDCIDFRAKDAGSEVAQAIRIIQRISDEVTVSSHEKEEFIENMTKAKLALAAALGHVLEIGEITSEMNESVVEDSNQPNAQQNTEEAVERAQTRLVAIGMADTEEHAKAFAAITDEQWKAIDRGWRTPLIESAAQYLIGQLLGIEHKAVAESEAYGALERIIDLEYFRGEVEPTKAEWFEFLKEKVLEMRAEARSAQRQRSEGPSDADAPSERRSKRDAA